MSANALNNTGDRLIVGDIVVYNSGTGVISRRIRPRDARKKPPKGCVLSVVGDDEVYPDHLVQRLIVAGCVDVRVGM